MAKVELKTKLNDGDVNEFINSIESELKRNDSFKIIKMMKKITKSEPKMWGDSIIGFGNYHYKYASGREGDWFLCGFSPRKQNLSIYIMSGFNKYENILSKLGKHKTGKGCLYVKNLEEIDLKVLENLIKQSVDYLKKRNS